MVRLDIETRHREHLTGLVEALQDRAAGIPSEPNLPVVGVVTHNLWRQGFKQWAK